MSQGDKPWQAVGASKLDLVRNGTVGLIDWLDGLCATSVMTKNAHEPGE
jgi:hypothetical protein